MLAPSLSRCRLNALAVLVCSTVAWAAVGCGPPDEGSRISNPGPVRGAFYVSNFFTPSGDMGDGQFAGNLITSFNEDCKPRPSLAGGDCYRFEYHVSTLHWAGVYWAFPSNSWGAYPGRSIIGPVDLGNGLHGYNSVTFSVATDQATLDATCPRDPSAPSTPKPCAAPPGLFLNFIAGGIDGSQASPPLPYSDLSCTGGPETCVPFRASHSTTLTTTDWQSVSIDVSNTPLTAVIGAFAWVSSFSPTAVPGQEPPQTIFIDDIIWK
jgi:hypothetical protein